MPEEAQRERRLSLRLICESPPGQEREGVPVEFGLQDKKGNLAAGAPAGVDALIFECDATAVLDAGGRVRLRGPFLQGPASAPFLYLSCRRSGPVATPWLFRLKVPLAGIDQAVLREGDSSEPMTLIARVRATAGGSVPLIADGWSQAPAGRGEAPPRNGRDMARRRPI